MECVQVIKNVSVKLFSFFSGGSICDQERVCQTLQLQLWREYWWSRTCLPNSSASSMECVQVIKNVSVKVVSFFNGRYIRDQERDCQTFQLHQWMVYSWPRPFLSSDSASSMKGIFMVKNVSVKLFCFINGGYIRDQERVCQTLQFLQWREYLWSRTCLSNSSASLMEGVLVIKNVSVKFFSFFNGRYIRDQDRVCQALQLLQWRDYWCSRTCLWNYSISPMEGLSVIKNVSVKPFSFSNGRCIGDQETCLSNSSASLMEGIFVIKNVSVKLFCFFNGASIRVEGRACQTLQLHQMMVYWWSRTCLSNYSASLMERLLVIKNMSFKPFFYINEVSIGDQERVCRTLQLL